MFDTSDEQLVAEYTNGDEKALAVLIERHTRGVYGFIARFFGYGAEAEDVTQETFIKVWKSLRRFDKNKNFKPWLYRIARNTAIDHLRSRKELVDLNKFTEDGEGDSMNELPDVSPSLLDQLSTREQMEKIRTVINSLPEIYRTVLDLHLREEMSLVEVAVVLKEKEETVKSRYRRGLARLRIILEV